MLIGIIGWAFLGLIVGFILSKSVNLHGDDPRFGIAVGIIGALVGGWVYSWISGTPISGFHLWSLVSAAGVAILTAAVWHVIRSRSPHESPSIRRSY